MNMAFRTDENEIRRHIELAQHLKVLKLYADGQIANEQMGETLAWLAHYCPKLAQQCREIQTILPVEDEAERASRYYSATRVIMEVLKREHPRDFWPAASLATAPRP